MRSTMQITSTTVHTNTVPMMPAVESDADSDERCSHIGGVASNASNIGDHSEIASASIGLDGSAPAAGTSYAQQNYDWYSWYDLSDKQVRDNRYQHRCENVPWSIALTN